MTKETRKIMIVAGEASGDTHAAKLMTAMRDAEPDVKFEFFGAAGPKMREAGARAVIQSDSLSVVGVAEIARALPMFIKAFRKLKAAAVAERPEAVILVDFPDFNLKLAKALKRKGLKIVYYISPQLWAWRKYRISIIKKYVDLMITILPFEELWYRERGVTHVQYVGNPLANEVRAAKSKEDFCRDSGLDPNKPIVALLPGSRHKEIVWNLPVLMASMAKIVDRHPDVQFAIAVGSPQNQLYVDAVLAEENAKKVPKLTNSPRTFVGQTFDVINASDAAVVTSGTATLETAIIGTPLVIVYKTSALNYVLLKPLISVEHYGLINLIAGQRIAKELIQNDFTADSVAVEVLRLLQKTENQEMRGQLRIASEKLGRGGAAKRAAEAIARLIHNRSGSN